ncbi:MAG: TonB-dependent receptor [bacterium]
MTAKTGHAWSQRALLVALAWALAGSTALAASDPGAAAADALPPEVVVVTATKLPEELQLVPVTVSVVSGDELRARGVVDLRTALSLTAGVDVSPGSDAGPAGSVPALWGLREFDAFLLVVDGVPWGGAFNPALATLDLTDVERIEVLRGAAPVSYGATSFVGVIHVIHHAAGKTPGRLSVAGGDRDTAVASASASLPALGALEHSLTVNGETRRFSQDDARVQRIHALYRAGADLGIGHAHLDVDVTSLRQDPASPHPREGSELTRRFPLDANVNPADAEQDQDRIQLNAGLTKDFGGVAWTTLYSVAYTDFRNVRGFLREDFADDGVTPNADGFAQDVYTTDMYFDSFLGFHPLETLGVAVGVDWLYGDGLQASENFEYAVLPDGSNRPLTSSLPVDERTRLTDRRHFAGVYSQVDWKPWERLDVIGGIRLNATFEKREGAVTPSEEGGEEAESGSDDRDELRASGMIGASYALWMDGSDRFSVFGNYRNTFKPAVVDFGPEAEDKILEPEEAESLEGGFRGRMLDGRLDWSASYFYMTFQNLVIAENVDGLPGKANAGEERFQGAELEAELTLIDDLRCVANYAYHSAKFTDFARLRPDGSTQQLAGNYLELSPKHLGGVGLVYAPATGIQGSVAWRYVGDRFLNKGNTSVAPHFHTVDAGVGYRVAILEKPVTFRVDGQNLTNARDAVTESELGDAQFYRMSGRSVLGSVALEF